MRVKNETNKYLFFILVGLYGTCGQRKYTIKNLGRGLKIRGVPVSKHIIFNKIKAGEMNMSLRQLFLFSGYRTEGTVNLL
jgi:hypothetical protein